MNKRKILTIFLSTLTVAFAFFAWRSVQRAVVVPDSSTWVMPMVLFSFYIVLLCLDAILLRNVLLLELLLIGSLALSLFFAFAWLQLGAIIVGGYLLFLASRKIRADMELNIKISTWKSLQVGKMYLLMSLSFVITMQYFVVMNNFDGEKKVPHFDVSFITKKIAIPFVSKINPQLRALNDETLTVDQFILQTQNNTIQDFALSAENEQLLESKLPAELDGETRETLKNEAMKNFTEAQTIILQDNQELILSDGRKQFSELAGVELTGSEKISDVFTGLVSNKIDSYFNPEVGAENNNSVFVMILATILLLIIYPIGSILSIVWFLVVKFVVFVLLKTKVLGVKSVTVSKEVLE